MDRKQAIEFGESRRDLFGGQMEEFIKLSVEALKKLEQEPSGDLISREETLNAFADYVGSGMSMNDYDALWDIVAKIPSVNPQEPKTGHWRPSIMGISECSECGYDNGLAKWNFCPICGARMIEPQAESER